MKSFFAIVLFFCFLTTFGQERIVVRIIDSTENQLVPTFQIKKNQDLKKEVISRLQQKGFINLKLNDSRIENDTLLYKADLGQQFSYLQFKIKSNQSKLLEKDSVLLSIDQYPQYVDELLNQLSEKGQVFSKIQLNQLTIKNDSTLGGKLIVNKSKKRRISAIKVKGYKEFPVSYLKYYLGLAESAVFDRKEIIKRSKRVNELVFANQTKDPQVQFTKDSTLLYMYLDKQKSNRFEGFLGFTNDDQQDLQLNGDLDLTLINNFNYGEIFNLQYKNNGSDQEQFNVNAELPFLFNTPFSLSVGLDFFRQDSTFSTSAQNLKVEYQVNRRWRLKTGAQFYRSTSLQDEQSIVLDTSVVDFKSNKLMVGSSFYFPTSIKTALPIKNSIDFETQIGKRTLLNTPDNEASDIRQFDFKLDNEWFIPINKRQFIYVGNFNRWLISDDYVTNELFRFGGMKNIRGFSENSLFADFYSVLQTEYRYILSSDLFIHSVIDLSHYENQLQNINKNLYSLGLGIGLQTKGGLLRLILANGNENGQNIQFDQTQFHIKFSSIF